MATNPIEVNYQTGRTIYCVRSSLLSSVAQFYNTVTGLYENYNSANWANYVIAIGEVGASGYYRATPPSASLTTPATEIVFEQQGASPAITDGPPIAIGNSQDAVSTTSANPIEVAYQVGRTIYAFRSALASALTQFFNTATAAYENYNVANWSNYAMVISEVGSLGYYRLIPVATSLVVAATEIIYEQKGVSPDVSDSPAIGAGSSQAGSPFIGTGSISSSADVCNLALTHIGQKTIGAITDSTENARKCLLIFSNCVKEVLRDAWWNFATVIALLTLNSDQTDNAVPGWAYVYDIPSDCLLVRKVYGETSPFFDTTVPPASDTFAVPITSPQTLPFRKVLVPTLGHEEIVCNITPAYIEYTSYVNDPAQWDAQFVKALSFKLASELAAVLTGSQDKARAMDQKYQIALSEAQKLNGNEDGVERPPSNGYVDARS